MISAQTIGAIPKSIEKFDLKNPNATQAFAQLAKDLEPTRPIKDIDDHSNKFMRLSKIAKKLSETIAAYQKLMEPRLKGELKSSMSKK